MRSENRKGGLKSAPGVLQLAATAALLSGLNRLNQHGGTWRTARGACRGSIEGRHRMTRPRPISLNIIPDEDLETGNNAAIVRNAYATSKSPLFDRLPLRANLAAHTPISDIFVEGCRAE